jgi:peptide/nickel transport system ATP-binding protein
MQNKHLLEIKDLKLSFQSNNKSDEVIHGISYYLDKNEILGIVGESGSGKSVSSLAIMGLLPKGISKVDSGKIIFENRDLLALNLNNLQSIRGNDIGMIFQEPMSSLNPSMRCGEQVLEIILQHTRLSKKKAKREVISLFEKVKLPTPEITYKKYPHEISGGQKQRVMIAMAIACKPRILIADEPTTALDVTVQKDIIDLLKTLQQENEMSIIFISHDLSLVSEIADRILVMYKGNIVEQGSTYNVFKRPNHTYTQALISSKPSLNTRLKQLSTISDVVNKSDLKKIITNKQRAENHKKLYSKPPLLQIINLEKSYISKAGFFGKTKLFKAVDKVSFKLYEGETLGLVGESGCGKSTLGNSILQLDKATSGTIIYKGKDITNLSQRDLQNLRKEIQIIFQDPYSSLNPRLTIGASIMEPMKVHKLFNTADERKTKALEILECVGLSAEHFNRYPHEFSGGQRQRIGIARTIAVEPKLIVCDESVSALDISVQAQVLNLLNELKDDFGYTYIFISHDLAVVKYMSDNLLVMNKGIIEEEGEADSIYANPKKDYTKKLIDAIPKGL